MISERAARDYRESIISGYENLIEEKIDQGFEAYYMNFMFRHITGTAAYRRQAMIREVDRVHHILTRHIVRLPHSETWARLRPIFIGSHDLPVWKHRKVQVQSLIVNDGLHFNAVALVPPPARTDMPIRAQFALMGRQSRLQISLDRHFSENRRFYLNDVLDRIHVTPIIKGNMVDYTLKAFKHGRVSDDSIQIWN